MIISPFLSVMTGRSQTFSWEIALTAEWMFVRVCVILLLYLDLAACVMQMEMVETGEKLLGLHLNSTGRCLQ